MKRVFACLLAVLMLAALIGCGSKGSGSASPIVGTWNLTKAIVSGIEVTAEQMGQSMSFTFNADGSASMTAKGTTTDGLSWTFANNVLKLSVQGVSLYDLNYDGSTLTLHEPNSGVDLIFER
ncbi:MAG: lipocalin family protein [Clostridia bacterium]|nr:lipocalin family protein [Clostridia bacterium]